MKVLSLSLAGLLLAQCCLAAPQASDQDFLDSLGVVDGAGGGSATEGTPPDCGNVSELSDNQFLASLTGGCGGGDLPAPEVMRCERNQFLCTPYFRCNESNIVSDGLGEFDVRINKQQFEEEHAFITHSECKRFGDVCCTSEQPRDSIPEPETYTPQCGHRNPQGIKARITGFKESESQFGETPWTAVVLRVETISGEEKNFFVCGGSLVDQRAVLTAAHCVDDLQPDVKLRVRLGEWDTQNENELLPHVDVDVERFVKHEDFVPRRLNDDVALLLLKEPVKLQPHIDTLCLPDPSVAYDAPRNCIATGWGKDAFVGGKFQTVLKLVPLPLVPHAECQSKLRTTRLRKYFALDRSFTCAGGIGGQDTCTGDGGSPLACEDPVNPGRYVQLGVVSWGIGCGQEGVPGVYADVVQQVAWIRRQLATLPALAQP